MKVLIIEDDQNKSRQLAMFVEAKLNGVIIVERRSYQSGLKEAILNQYDVVLLDMSMPTFDTSPVEQGGRTRPYAGREIMRELCRQRVRQRVIVVTQYETFHERGEEITLVQLRDDLRRGYPDVYIATIFYDVATLSWTKELEAALKAAIPGVVVRE